MKAGVDREHVSQVREDGTCRAQAEGQPHVVVKLPVPLEAEQPPLTGQDRNEPEGVLEVRLGEEN